jgi:thioredoxin
MLKQVTDADFDKEVLAQKQAVLVDFWAEWCGPCKALAPALDALAKDYKDLVQIVKLDVDKNADTRDRFGIRGIPALLLFKEGREVARHVGAQTRAKLGEFLDTHIGRAHQNVKRRAEANIPAKAFGGDLAQKQSCIARVEEYIARCMVRPGETEGICFWEGAFALPTHESVSVLLGIPLALVFAIDSLSTSYGTAAAGAVFVLAWLKEIPAGADLSMLPRDLLLAVLEGEEVCDVAALDEGFSALRQKIVSAHQAPDDATSWAELREAVGMQIIGTSGLLRALGKCLQNACWPSTEAEMLKQTIISAAFLPAIKISLEMEWSETEARAMERLLLQHGQALIAEQRSPLGAWDLVFQENPELAERYKRHSFAYHDGIRKYGQFAGQALVALTRAA